MNRRGPRPVAVALFLLCVVPVSACAGGGENAGASAPTTQPTPTSQQSFPMPGTSWTYDNTVTFTSVPDTIVPQSGILEVLFDGSQQYRGASSYAADFSGGAFSNGVRSYYGWNVGSFEEQAENDMLLPVLPGCNAPKREAILNAGLDFLNAGNSSGQATLYQCSTSAGSKAWSLSVTDGGTSVTTTAAGAFPTHVWKSKWTFGTNERDFTTYAFGVDIIERDVSEYNSGAPFANYTIKLRSGPTTVAIPPVPVMYPYDF